MAVSYGEATAETSTVPLHVPLLPRTLGVYPPGPATMNTSPTAYPLPLAGLVFLLILAGTACSREQPIPRDYDWPIYRADNASSNYAPLDQINRDNVAQLELVWTYHTGDRQRFTIECNPIIVDGVMYVTSPAASARALDAATGTLIWSFSPWDDPDVRKDGQRVNRGVTYWAEGDDQRILYPSGTRLYALDAHTGTLIPTFGEGGSIDLTQGLDRDVGAAPVSATTPGIIFEDLIIMGSATPDGLGNNPPGHIRAYDVRTGERAWIFHTIPHPGEEGYETWPEDAWKTAGGNNAWAGMSLDVERGVVYAPTGSPAYDHNGFNRHGTNLFGNTVLALDARTGARLWHYQTVHHDLWDYDLASPPTLATLTHDGIRKDAVVQATKMGHLFVLDRDTGEPLFPVEERAVPQSTIPGEQTWPTQPFPVKPPPYAKQGFQQEDITDLSPEAHAYVTETYFDAFGPAVLFEPLSTTGTFIMPQFNGGTDWGGGAFDPATGRYYVSASNEPEALTMRKAPADASHPYAYVASGHDEIYDPEGFPVSKRPWGTLNAIDLNAGEIVWQVPLGTYPELERRGLPPTGTFNMGGPIVTAGGVIFIGATRDERFRAFDATTGTVLWEYQLPAGGYATPSTYMVDGRQYVVIAAAGGGKPGTKPGDAYMAFALPAATP